MKSPSTKDKVLPGPNKAEQVTALKVEGRWSEKKKGYEQLFFNVVLTLFK